MCTKNCIVAAVPSVLKMAIMHDSHNASVLGGTTLGGKDSCIKMHNAYCIGLWLGLCIIKWYLFSIIA
jgi:hypothetical protein